MGLAYSNSLSEYMIMGESSYPNSKPLSGEEKPIMGSKTTYSQNKWNELNVQFDSLRKTLDIGSREALVSVVKFLCNLDMRIPYANFEYQIRYDKNYAIYPHIGLNSAWGEPYRLNNGEKLPPQGMYCSALIEWAFVNAGIPYNFKITTNAKSYLGKVMSTKKAFKEGLIKEGDLIYTSQQKSESGRMFNHIGVIIEVCRDYILVAEMRPLRGLVVTKASKFSRLDTVVVESKLYKD